MDPCTKWVRARSGSGHTFGVGGRLLATAGVIHTTHASFLREPGGGADPLRPAR